MKETIVKCKCDYCSNDMTESEYDNSVKIFIQAQVPNPSGQAGETSGVCMHICNNCSEKLGIVPKEIFNGRMGEKERIKTPLEKFKTKILDMFFNKSSGKKED